MKITYAFPLLFSSFPLWVINSICVSAHSKMTVSSIASHMCVLLKKLAHGHVSRTTLKIGIWLMCGYTFWVSQSLQTGLHFHFIDARREEHNSFLCYGFHLLHPFSQEKCQKKPLLSIAQADRSKNNKSSFFLLGRKRKLIEDIPRNVLFCFNLAS